MYRIKLMILWGLLFSIWLCKSLFANSGTETEINGRTEVSGCAKAMYSCNFSFWKAVPAHVTAK